MGAPEEIEELIREEIPKFCNGEINSQVVAQDETKSKTRYPVPTFGILPPFVDGIGLRTKSSLNTVTYHRIPINSPHFDVLHLLVSGYKEKADKPFEVFRIQAGATISGGLEKSLIIKSIKLGLIKRRNHFVPLPPADEPVKKNLQNTFSEIFKTKKYWNNSLDILNNNEPLIKSINKLMTEVEVKSNYVVYSTTKTISFEDELVGVGCLVPNAILRKGVFAIFQTVPEFVRHTVRRYQSLRLEYLLESINLCAQSLRNNSVEKPDSTFWQESSVSTMLNHLLNLELQKTEPKGQDV